MTRFNLPLAVVMLTNSFFAATTANACGGGGGVYRRPAVRSYAAPAIRYAPAPRTVVVHQPVIRTYTVAAPTVVQSTPVPQIRLAPTQVRPKSTIASTPVSSSTSVASQPSTAVTPAPNASSPTTTSPSESSPRSDGGGLSALAILSGQTPQSAPSETPAGASHIGVWTAQANGQSNISLSLNSDNSFEWAASNNGSMQRFRGTFELSGNKLTLSRSTDNQKMTGTLTFTGSGFNFKLNGAKDSGLEFSRQS